jgi:hypothetical protein
MPRSRSRDLISSITNDSVCREVAACVKRRASTMCPAARARELDLGAGERARADPDTRLRALAIGADQDPIDCARRRRYRRRRRPARSGTTRRETIRRSRRP